MSSLVERRRDGLDGPRSLEISTAHSESEGRIVLEVQDNGPGIPEEIRSRIFEPFFTTKEVGTGTGIGLAVCHRLIESHGGTIKVESAPGAGTTFVVRLPVAGDRPGSEEEPEAETGSDFAAQCLDKYESGDNRRPSPGAGLGEPVLLTFEVLVSIPSTSLTVDCIQRALSR